MTRFQSIEDVRTFCRSLAKLASDMGDEKVSLILLKALAAGDTNMPTERLGESILGLEGARKIMDERYPQAVIDEVNEAIDLGREGLRRANLGINWRV